MGLSKNTAGMSTLLWFLLMLCVIYSQGILRADAKDTKEKSFPLLRAEDLPPQFKVSRITVSYISGGCIGPDLRSRKFIWNGILFRSKGIALDARRRSALAQQGIDPVLRKPRRDEKDLELSRSLVDKLTVAAFNSNGINVVGPAGSLLAGELPREHEPAARTIASEARRAHDKETMNDLSFMDFGRIKYVGDMMMGSSRYSIELRGRKVITISGGFPLHVESGHRTWSTYSFELSGLVQKILQTVGYEASYKPPDETHFNQTLSRFWREAEKQALERGTMEIQ